MSLNYKKSLFLSVSLVLFLFASCQASSQTLDIRNNPAWTGYEVTRGNNVGYSSITGTWTVPLVKCTGTSSSAFWIGLGGDTTISQSNHDLEQMGTSADCVHGDNQYYLWTEMVEDDAQGSITYPIDIKPGDLITATIIYTPQQMYNFSVSVNHVSQVIRTVSGDANSRQSAEWIVEAPLLINDSGNTIGSLSNFGLTRISNCLVDTKILGDQPIIYRNQQTAADTSVYRSTLTPLESDRNSFTVVYIHA